MSADQLLTHVFNAGVAVSIISTVLALGSYSVADAPWPNRRPRSRWRPEVAPVAG